MQVIKLRAECSSWLVFHYLAQGYMSSPCGEGDPQKKHVLLLAVRPVLRQADGADGPHIDFCMESEQ